MTDPYNEQQQMKDLAKALITIYVIMEMDAPFYMAQTHADNPEIGASEVVELIVRRRHIEPLEVAPVGKANVIVRELVMV